MGLIERKAAWTDVERAIERIAGPHGLMIIFRADQGKIASLSGDEKRCSLYLVGNPVIANQTIISIDLRASFYVPFRSGLYDNGGFDGAVISYDRPSPFLATLERPELKVFGEMLDRKIDDGKFPMMGAERPPPSVVSCARGSGSPEAALPLSEARLIGSVDALHPVEIRLVREHVGV